MPPLTTPPITAFLFVIVASVTLWQIQRITRAISTMATDLAATRAGHSATNQSLRQEATDLRVWAHRADTDLERLVDRLAEKEALLVSVRSELERVTADQLAISQRADQSRAWINTAQRRAAAADAEVSARWFGVNAGTGPADVAELIAHCLTTPPRNTADLVPLPTGADHNG